MLEKIISQSIKKRVVVITAIVVVLLYGFLCYKNIPLDAFPDISPVMVPVFAEAHGMAPEEVERLITFPIEAAMNGLPGVTEIKSTSAFGMAVVYVYFEDDVDIYFARQLVAERLADARNSLPEMHDPPTLGPISSGLGQVFLYYLTLAPNTDTGGKPPLAYLREINDWIVKLQLQTVPGVTDVLSMGGYVLQYQIRIDPYALRKYRLTIRSVIDGIQANNRNVGGQFLVIGAEEYLIRGLGLLGTLDHIRNIRLKTINGVPITVKDVAEVTYGNEIRRGVVTRNGEEVVSGIVMKLYGENTSKVIEKLYEKVAEVQKSLPPRVTLVPYYEQATLVKKAVGTVENALLVGGVLVTLVLMLFLGDFRSAFIVISALPVCTAVAFIFMKWWGISANLMSLGGIAVAIGMLGDGTIVVVENIYRHLGERRERHEPKDVLIKKAATEVATPVFFSVMVIVTVFLPIFTLQSVEGKIFSPMAFTIVFALAGSLVAALTAAPALSHYILPHREHLPSPLFDRLRSVYSHLLQRAMRNRTPIIATTAGGLLLAIMAVPFLGTEFVPKLEEGNILIGVTMPSSISLNKGVEIVTKMEKAILKHPEVKEVVSRIGRPEAGSHPHPVNYAEIHVELIPQEEWTRFESKEELVNLLAAELEMFPGVFLNFTQPIQNAFDELLSGVRAEVAIKIFGEDLTVLREKAEEIRSVIEDVPGLVDLAVEQSFGQPQIQVLVNRDACARLGIDAEQILDLIEIAVGGQSIGTIFLGTRRFAIHVRYQERYRDNIEAISNLLVQTADGSLIPLSQVATVKKALGPIQINRENNHRRWIVQGNVRGRDLGSVIADIRKRIEEKIELPPNYFIEYGGQFENQQRAMARLLMIVPFVILLVFLLLYMSFNQLRHAVMIILNIPLALIGGVLGLLVTREYLSVPASIGFIALFGIALQNSMVLVSQFNHLLARGMNVQEAVETGAILRLRPVLMTATTTILGLLPLLLSSGTGAEVQRPLATVVVSGLLTSTLLTLFVLPVVYVATEPQPAIQFPSGQGGEK